MSTLTTNDIKNVGQLQEKNEFASNDALLAWDAAGQKHVKLTYQKLNQAYSTIQSACETAQGAAEDAAAEAAGFAKGTGGGTYTNNNAEYFKTQAAAEALKSEGWAEGTENGTDVPSTSPYHEHNSKYWATQAGTSAGSAGTDALKAEGFAVGQQNGTDVPSTSPYYENNAKYYKDQAGISASSASSYKNDAEAAANQARSYAAIILMASGTVDQQKTVSLPASGLLEGQIIRVMFPVGHNAAGSAVYMTLNGNLVLSNQNGTLAPIPIHSMTEGSSTVYKVLDPNTTLEMYYTADYDGNSTPAWVVIGNPVVLSDSNYTIYADGKKLVDPSNQTLIYGPLRSISVQADVANWFVVETPTIPSDKIVLRWTAQVQSNPSGSVRVTPSYYRDNDRNPDSVFVMSDTTQTISVGLLAVVI